VGALNNVAVNGHQHKVRFRETLDKRHVNSYISIYLFPVALEVNPVAATSDTGEGSPIHTMAVGAVQEWSVGGTANHPFHLHINPMQIVQLGADPTGYMQVGDFHDVMFEHDAAGPLRVRFQTDRFTGTMAVPLLIALPV
jgi:FtsP/CotA-like multicopper oxidase with cupredoxin domain